MKKHAYLIIAHNHFDQLQTLLELIDDERNDIYLHVDRKAKEFNASQLYVKYSSLTLVDRLSISWGGHSLVWCELNLLKAAVPKHYEYYHLLSGNDLPLKSQDEIHAFFDKNGSRDYIGFDISANESKNFMYRVRYFHFLRNLITQPQPTQFWEKLLNRLEGYSLKIQQLLKVKRKEHFPLYKGDQWFSITDELAKFIVLQSKTIKKQFRFSACSDELLVQSMVMHPQYQHKKRLAKNCLRAIDWNRSNGMSPYTYRAEDVATLLASPSLWARKFDQCIDAKAIELVSKHLKSK